MALATARQAGTLTSFRPGKVAAAVADGGGGGAGLGRGVAIAAFASAAGRLIDRLHGTRRFRIAIVVA